MNRMARRLAAVFAATTLATVPMLAQERGGPNKDGIKVHGHWTIDVRRADGTLVSHHEFENALTSTGAMGLGLVLTRYYTMGGWGVMLDGGVCQGTFAPLCAIQEPSATAGTADSTDLSVMVPGPGAANQGLLVLKGSVKTSTAGQITGVRTRLATCSDQTVSETTCAAQAQMSTADNVFDVTSRTLATPIPVDAGQFVQVTVVLSFS